MTSPGQYATGDGSFARSAGGAAGRGIVLILIALAVGIFLLYRGFGGSDDTATTDEETGGDAGDSADTAPDPDDSGDGAGGDVSSNGDSTEVAPEDDTTVPPPQTPLVTNPPGEVKVATVNGTGESGLASAAAGLLMPHGYVTTPKNAEGSQVPVSVIYYRAGYSEDAKAVAAHLSAPAHIITPAPDNVLTLVSNSDPVADFNIFVVLGMDEIIPV